MEKRASSHVVFLSLLVLLSVLFTVAFFPARSHAISNPGTGANAACLPVVIPVCGCGQVMGSRGCTGGINKFMCPCIDSTSGFDIPGKCMATGQCKAMGASDGKFDAGMQQLMKSLGELLGKLMKGGGGGDGGGAPPPPPGAEGCTQFFQTSDISQLSNPCAQYQAPVSGDINTTPTPTGSGGCDPLSAALGMCGGESTGTSTNTNMNINTNTNTTGPIASGPRIIFATTSVGGLGVRPQGARGDIVMGGGGVTVVAGTRDSGSNVEVAGFYGSGTGNTQQSQGIIAGWCQTRPWAENFLSKIVAPTFFDGLCAARGYQVGLPPPPPPPILSQTSTKSPQPTTTTSAPAATVTNTIPPKVDIWAVPASVPLSARTSIFWNTQGVVSCTISSSDGSFNQNSLSGGAATVPIIAATTFTISCLAPDGSPVTGHVTVNLAI